MKILKETLENGYIRMFPSDWRYSAAIVGLVRFFDAMDIKYEIDDDFMEYKLDDVIGEETQKKYLLFAEKFFAEGMHHKLIEELLSNDVLSNEQEKLVNEKLKANSVCKKIFEDIKYSTENSNEILKTINENRYELIRETYRNGKSMYAKFINTGKLFSDQEKISRLLGYYVDLGKKSKSAAYYWNFNTFIASDEPEFDFIPFAFSKSREGFFINNNYSIAELLRANDKLQEGLDDADEEGLKRPREVLFKTTGKSAAFIDYDVEVIIKKQEEDYFKTLYIRSSAIEIFKNIKEDYYKTITYPCKCDSEYIPVEEIVTNSIINKIYLDFLIEKLLKDKNNHDYLISRLIIINNLIYGGSGMDDKLDRARKTAYMVKQSIESNKVTAYRQKLISAVVFKDYDRFCEILLQLASYSGVVFNFAYDLFDDFEGNKNVAYAFVNGLNERQED